MHRPLTYRERRVLLAIAALTASGTRVTGPRVIDETRISVGTTYFCIAKLVARGDVQVRSSKGGHAQEGGRPPTEYDITQQGKNSLREALRSEASDQDWIARMTMLSKDIVT